MFRFIKKLISDVGRGENIENYLVIGIAIIVIVLDVFGIRNEEWLSEITLAVLGLLAYDRMETKKVLNSIGDSVNGIRKGHVFEKSDDVDTTQVKKRIESMKTIDWLTFTNRKTISSFEGALNTFLSKGGQLRILLVDPESGFPKMLADLGIGDKHDPQGYFRSEVEKTRRKCKELKDSFPNSKIDLRYLKAIPPFRLTIYNSASDNGYLRVHFLKAPNTPVAMTIAWNKPDDLAAFSYFADQYERLWKEGSQISLT